MGEREGKQHQHKRDYVSAQSCLAEGPGKKESSSIFKCVQLDAFGCFLPIFQICMDSFIEKKKALQTAWETSWAGAHKSPATDRDTWQSTCRQRFGAAGQHDTGSGMDPLTDSVYARY